MYSTKNNIIYFIVFIAFVQVQSLVELREKDKVLAVTEAAVRKTVNGIFSILNLDHGKHRARFGEFAAIHNFLVTITFKDDDNLKEIARITRADNQQNDNNTQYFITQINEVLNEDNKSYEATEDEHVTAHIETFIRKLEYLKFKYGFGHNNDKFGINTEVLNHLIPDDSSINISKTAIINKTDGNLLNSHEFWNPSTSRRIFEGRRETIKRFPFMASVQFFKKFQCAGSIIKSDLVITSASCLQLAWNNRFFRENPAFLSVQVGCDLYEGCDENIPVLEVYFHPEYNPKNLMNNLAIMRLVRILKFGRRIKKIKKIDFDRNPWPLPTNTRGITIVGWGARNPSNIVSNVWNNRLAYAVLDFYPLRECQEVYSREYVTSKHFCAGFFSKGGGACNRDAGGPGVVGGKLYGVVSFGAPTCGAPDAPTVFTKLGYYTDWIEDILQMKTPTGLRSTTERTTREPFKLDSFTIKTTSEFRIIPFTKPEDMTEEPPMHVPKEDALRSLDENQLFKEFIKTMFGSEEVKEYLDQSESGADASDEDGLTDQAMTRELSRNAIVRPSAITEKKIEELSSVEYEVPQDLPGSIRMVTKIDDFDAMEIKSDEEVTTPAVIGSTPNEQMDEEEQVEQNIAKLIDDIDIQDLLESETREKSAETEKVKIKSKTKKDTKERNKPKKAKKVEVIEKIVESASNSKEESGKDTSYDDDDEYEHLSVEPLPTKIKITTKPKKKAKQGKKKKAPNVLDEPYKDATFRQNGTDGSGGGNIFNILSKNDIWALLNKAVADAAESSKSKQITQGVYDDREEEVY